MCEHLCDKFTNNLGPQVPNKFKNLVGSLKSLNPKMTLILCVLIATSSSLAQQSHKRFLYQLVYIWYVDNY